MVSTKAMGGFPGYDIHAFNKWLWIKHAGGRSGKTKTLNHLLSVVFSSGNQRRLQKQYGGLAKRLFDD